MAMEEYIGRKFQSTHPVWGATGCPTCSSQRIYISIHAPRVGCDQRGPAPGLDGTDFNPRTPCGVRQAQQTIPHHTVGFQSTHPVWGATKTSSPLVWSTTNFNPRTPCGVRLTDIVPLVLWIDFNPRTPCGVRPGGGRSPHLRTYFNPRTPCGVRHYVKWINGYPAKFQSTHPVWGATCREPCPHPSHIHFNPRTPCGVRRGSTWTRTRPPTISIHAPRVGCDDSGGGGPVSGAVFQSTHPVWGATM